MDEFREDMDDDLGTPAVAGRLFDLVSRANAALDEGDVAEGGSAAASAFEIAGALGLELGSEDDRVDAVTARLMAERDAARAARDYARSDAIRDELEAKGWTVQDGHDGTRVHRRRAVPPV